jgi:hypothetical protein
MCGIEGDLMSSGSFEKRQDARGSYPEKGCADGYVGHQKVTDIWNA